MAYEMSISDWSSDVCSSDLGSCDVKDILPVERRRKQDSSAAAGPQRPASGPLELLLDAAEDRAPPAVEHLDAHAVAELEKGRLGGPVQQGLHRALRSEERRGGQEGVRKCRSRWVPYH